MEAVVRQGVQVAVADVPLVVRDVVVGVLPGALAAEVAVREAAAILVQLSAEMIVLQDKSVKRGGIM